MSSPARVNASVTSNFIPSGVSPFSGGTTIFGTALVANPRRASMFVQNVHTGTALYLLLGSTAAGTGAFSMILNPAGNVSCGGDIYTSDIYKGQVTASGGAWIAWEM